MIENTNFPTREEENTQIPEPSTRSTSVSLELNLGENIESRGTQEFVDSQGQHFDFLSYTEEELLDWDVVITPPPRPSGVIRVKLKYKGRSKPFPADGFWEE